MLTEGMPYIVALNSISRQESRQYMRAQGSFHPHNPHSPAPLCCTAVASSAGKIQDLCILLNGMIQKRVSQKFVPCMLCQPFPSASHLKDGFWSGYAELGPP